MYNDLKKIKIWPTVISIIIVSCTIGTFSLGARLGYGMRIIGWCFSIISVNMWSEQQGVLGYSAVFKDRQGGWRWVTCVFLVVSEPPFYRTASSARAATQTNCPYCTASPPHLGSPDNSALLTEINQILKACLTHKLLRASLYELSNSEILACVIFVLYILICDIYNVFLLRVWRCK